MRIIWLTKGQFTIVDDEDFELVNQYTWHALKSVHTYYAATNVRKGKKVSYIYMHRLILGLTDKKILADHKDHNGLNNQRYNLRIATRSQNNANRMPEKTGTSKYLGVHWNKDCNKWHAQLGKRDSKKKYIGIFENEIDAAKAYNKRALEVHGEFANLNNV